MKQAGFQHNQRNHFSSRMQMVNTLNAVWSNRFSKCPYGVIALADREFAFYTCMVYVTSVVGMIVVKNNRESAKVTNTTIVPA